MPRSSHDASHRLWRALGALAAADLVRVEVTCTGKAGMSTKHTTKWVQFKKRKEATWDDAGFIMMQVEAVETVEAGHVDVSAAVHLQPDVFHTGSTAPNEPSERQHQPQDSPSPAAAQHVGSVQVLMDHLLQSRQARWLDAAASAATQHSNHKHDPGWCSCVRDGPP